MNRYRLSSVVCLSTTREVFLRCFAGADLANYCPIPRPLQYFYLLPPPPGRSRGIPFRLAAELRLMTLVRRYKPIPHQIDPYEKTIGCNLPAFPFAVSVCSKQS